MTSPRRAGLALALIAAVAGFAFLIGRLAHEEPPAAAPAALEPPTARAPQTPVTIEPALRVVPAEPSSAAPAAILSVARLHVKLTGVP
jgi:hypothetical protein